ncbi:CRISPR-associated protein, Csm2 family [Methanosarcina sp. MTP4]|uniref:type III-A CRISPR-associated protein Csm2 n=1 Tax=Methanosarcina sp. MTP4 TaxID=1434100 RepID=UPI0006160513|nr:type III-A CRISPR-associated protein Csm2 [Methanosarcina sp. MTP4]AKB26315.1 CRISPR-associated protein, Csm2 family [Methanosarcina sp. MTP4]
MSEDNELSNLLKIGRLIELCNVAKNSDSWMINKWYEKEERVYIRPLMSGSDIDSSKILNASCIMGIKLSKDKITFTQLRRLLTGFQIVKEKTKIEKTKTSGIKPADISKLKLNLAYITARNSNLTRLTDLLDSMLDNERFPENTDLNNKQFELVVTLLEGVIAYHKLAGGRD